MRFRDAYMARYERDPEEVLDEYQKRSDCEDINGHVKEHYRLASGLLVVGMRVITRHMTWTQVVMHVVVMIRMQHAVTEIRLSTIHIPCCSGPEQASRRPLPISLGKGGVRETPD